MKNLLIKPLWLLAVAVVYSHINLLKVLKKSIVNAKAFDLLRLCAKMWFCLVGTHAELSRRCLHVIKARLESESVNHIA